MAEVSGIDLILNHIKSNYRSVAVSYKQDIISGNHTFKFNINGHARLFEITELFLEDYGPYHIIKEIENLHIIDSIIAGPGNYIFSSKGFKSLKHL